MRGGEGAVPLDHGTLFAVPRCFSLNTQIRSESHQVKEPHVQTDVELALSLLPFVGLTDDLNS